LRQLHGSNVTCPTLSDAPLYQPNAHSFTYNLYVQAGETVSLHFTWIPVSYVMRNTRSLPGKVVD